MGKLLFMSMIKFVVTGSQSVIFYVDVQKYLRDGVQWKRHGK